MKTTCVKAGLHVVIATEGRFLIERHRRGVWHLHSAVGETLDGFEETGNMAGEYYPEGFGFGTMGEALRHIWDMQ